ncbi:LA_2272 family surface repeat-containing protein [Flammeovirga kamogawensis]|uniref:Uncharacterized protein n=1 Tax=Flammeovirga kamogawensis TaxID=373891 RepID=A0ABX8GRJ1_9BACT|nr:hypothetical protein [Flammeovirga kamogawensis]MBB6462733.1 hypothetical protein [Flammeovirga kamogawensis]QWG06034.1 hypothetical protein KM029_11745 [Flammeovirga kamogawensis]TRX67866.1 hypothetical protein EO216_06765 [Flammeovirga kamogawensis]
MKNLIAYLIISFLSTQFIFAQDSLQNKAYQVSFLYPVGTNGTSTTYSNDYSFNVLWGINSGVHYFELGGIANINKGDVKGGQIAGITNITKGTSKGFVCAGINNFASKNMDGLHIAGISNFTNESGNGGQISGISNIANKDMNGVQISLINTVRGEMTGAQIGLINTADSLKGTQIGLINVVTNGTEGTPIGLINIVKGGYYAVEVAADATIWGNINFKMGTKKFYTIFKGGYTQHNSKDVYSYGLGFGSMMEFGKLVNLSLDLSSNYLAYDGDYEQDLNLLNKADLNVHFKLTKKISVFAGPSLNVYISDLKVDGNETAGTLDIPDNTFYDHTNAKGTRTSIWLGANAGLNFSF